MKTVLIVFIAVILAVVAWAAFACEDDWCFLFEWQKARATSSFEECEARGFPVMESFPRQCRAGEKLFVENVTTPPGTPSGTPPPNGGIPTQTTNMRVFEPQPNQTVGLPLIIRGEARVFENAFNYRIKDADGTVLYEGHDMANAPDIGQFGPFRVEVSYPAPNGNTGTVEVFAYSARDGSEIEKVVIPVLFDSNVEAQTVKVFFSSKAEDPDALHCDITHPVDRRIARTTSPARRTIEELLKGPDRVEFEKGYSSSINSGVTIRSISITGGVARVDFDDMLEAGVAGSCRVQAIRSQIENTLKQFSTVSSVIISINGRTTDILQP